MSSDYDTHRLILRQTQSEDYDDIAEIMERVYPGALEGRLDARTVRIPDQTIPGRSAVHRGQRQGRRRGDFADRQVQPLGSRPPVLGHRRRRLSDDARSQGRHSLRRRRVRSPGLPRSAPRAPSLRRAQGTVRESSICAASSSAVAFPATKNTGMSFRRASTWPRFAPARLPIPS